MNISNVRNIVECLLNDFNLKKDAIVQIQLAEYYVNNDNPWGMMIFDVRDNSGYYNDTFIIEPEHFLVSVPMAVIVNKLKDAYMNSELAATLIFDEIDRVYHERTGLYL